MIVSQVNATWTSPLAITRKTTLAFFSVNGPMARTKDKSDTYWVRNIAKFLHSTGVDVMGVEERDIATEDQLPLVQKSLGRFNYKIHCALTSGTGGVAVIYHMQWELLSHDQVDDHVLHVILDPDGIHFSLLVGHLHHTASDRDAQWKKLQTHFHSFDQVPMFVLT